MIKFFFTPIFFIAISLSSAKANLAYITNEKDNTVSVIDIKKKKVIKKKLNIVSLCFIIKAQ